MMLLFAKITRNFHIIVNRFQSLHITLAGYLALSKRWN